MSSQSKGLSRFLVGGGVVAVAALVSIAVFDYPPATEDAAGTIVPAKRFRADGGGSTIVGDSSATQSDASAALDAGLRAQAADAVSRAQAADAVSRAQAADAVSRAQAADAVSRAQAADAVSRAQAADAVSRAQAADAVVRTQ